MSYTKTATSVRKRGPHKYVSSAPYYLLRRTLTELVPLDHSTVYFCYVSLSPIRFFILNSI